jgi:hypothetical protein
LVIKKYGAKLEFQNSINSMDKNFGDIIYLVLMVAVVLFSAFRKKKTTKQGLPEPHREVRDPMDEIFPTLKDLFNGEEGEEKPLTEQAESHLPLVSIEKTDKRKKESPFLKADYVFSARSSMDDVRRRRRIPIKKALDLDSQEQGDFCQSDVIEDFDLQKAVIYSEILKRPDF